VTEQECGETGTNQACYGYLVLEAEPQPGLTDFVFEQPGDIVNVTDVQNLRLSSMDTETGRWGVALMQIEANLLPDQIDDVTFVLFGDVEVGSALHLLRVTTAEDVNIRSEPAVTSEIVGTLLRRQTAVANGRLEDNSWLRVQIPDGVGRTGWVLAELLRPSGDLDSLDVIDPSLAISTADDGLRPEFGPMQAFYFKTGIDDAPCAEAPNSGLLIQTPEGVAEVTLWMNEVVIHMNATAYIQAEPGGDMSINVIEGTVEVEAQGQTHTAVAGTQVIIPIDEDLTAAGPPSAPQPYDSQDVEAIPINLLDRPVEVAPPLSIQSGVPIVGNWSFGWGVDEMQCANGRAVAFETAVVDTLITVQNEGTEVVMLGIPYSRTQSGVYSAVFSDSQGNLHRSTLNVISPDRIIGSADIEFIGLDCTLTVPFQLSLVSK
jgi:hypothetical protein